MKLPSSILIRQPLNIRNLPITLKLRLIRLLGQNSRLKPELPTPLNRRLRLPRPINPSPSGLKCGQLRYRKCLKKTFMRVEVCGRVSVCGVAVAVGGSGTVGFAAEGIHGAGPAVARVDVVEVLSAVGVGLGPFAADSGTPA